MSLTKLTIPILLLGPILGTAFGAGGAIMVQREQIKTLDRNYAETKAEVKQLQKDKEEQRIDTIELKTKMEYTVKALERLETKFGTNRE